MAIRIEFHEAGFRELLTSAGAKALVRGYAEDMAAKANAVPSTTSPAATEPYYEVKEDEADGDRARYRVRTMSDRAAKHEMKTQALQKAI